MSSRLPGDTMPQSAEASGCGNAYSHGNPIAAGVESVDLVVVLVGDQRAARGEFVLHDADAFKRNPLRFEERAVFGKILARRGEDKRLFAHQRQRIGDVPRAAAALFHQPVDEEAYIQNM